MESVTLLLPFASLLLAGAVALLVVQLSPRRSTLQKLADFSPVVVRGSLGAQRQELIDSYPLYRLMLPLISWLGAQHAKFTGPGYAQRVQLRLNAAGNPGAFTPDEIWGLRVVLALALPLLAYFVMAGAVILVDGGR